MFITGQPSAAQISSTDPYQKIPKLLVYQGSKLLGFRISETPKNDEGNPNFRPGFPTGNP